MPCARAKTCVQGPLSQAFRILVKHFSGRTKTPVSRTPVKGTPGQPHEPWRVGATKRLPPGEAGRAKSDSVSIDSARARARDRDRDRARDRARARARARDRDRDRARDRHRDRERERERETDRDRRLARKRVLPRRPFGDRH